MVFIPRWERYKEKQPTAPAELGNQYSSEEFANAFVFQPFGTTILKSNGKITSEIGISYDHEGMHVDGANGSHIQFDKPIDIAKYSEGTLIFRAARGTSTKNEGVYSDKTSSNWGASEGFSINLRSSGGLLFRIMAGESSTVSPIFNQGEYHDVIAMYKAGTATRIYVDGVEVNYYAHQILPATLVNSSAPNYLRLGAYYSDSGSYSSKISMPYLYHFGSVLDIDKAKEISAAPYQILKPRRRWFVFGSVSANIFNQSISLATKTSLTDSTNTSFNVSSILSSAYTTQTDPVVSAELNISLDSLHQLQNDISNTVNGSLLLTTKSGVVTSTQIYTTIDVFVNIANNYGINHSVSVDYNPVLNLDINNQITSLTNINYNVYSSINLNTGVLHNLSSILSASVLFNHNNSISDIASLSFDFNISLGIKELISTLQHLEINPEVILNTACQNNIDTNTVYNPSIELSNNNSLLNNSITDYNTSISLAVRNIISSSSYKEISANIALLAQQGISTTQLMILEGSIDLGVINTYSNDTLTSMDVNVDLTSAFLESLGTSVVSQLDISLDASYEVLSNGRNPNLVIRTNKGQEILVKAVNKDLKIQYIDRNIYI